MAGTYIYCRLLTGYRSRAWRAPAGDLMFPGCSVSDLYAKYNCTYCQEDITGLRVRCVECPDFDLCLQVSQANACFSVTCSCLSLPPPLHPLRPPSYLRLSFRPRRILRARFLFRFPPSLLFFFFFFLFAGELFCITTLLLIRDLNETADRGETRVRARYRP